IRAADFDAVIIQWLYDAHPNVGAAQLEQRSSIAGAFIAERKVEADNGMSNAERTKHAAYEFAWRHRREGEVEAHNVHEIDAKLLEQLFLLLQRSKAAE